MVGWGCGWKRDELKRHKKNFQGGENVCHSIADSFTILSKGIKLYTFKVGSLFHALYTSVKLEAKESQSERWQGTVVTGVDSEPSRMGFQPRPAYLTTVRLVCVTQRRRASVSLSVRRRHTTLLTHNATLQVRARIRAGREGLYSHTVVTTPQCCCGDTETICWECELVEPLWSAVQRLLNKLKAELPYDPAITLRYLCKGYRCAASKGHMHPNV